MPIDEGKGGGEMSEKKVKEETLAFYKLFSFADKYDYLLMGVGT